MIRFCRTSDVSDVDVIDMRFNARQPYCRLNFDYQHGQIPVPGLRGMYAESVTGILEGLRLVGPTGRPGKVNCGYFVGAGRPRPLKTGQWCSGYSYKGRAVNLAEARRLLIIPSYQWVLANKVQAVVAKISKLARVRAVGLYDGYGSADLHVDARLSAAAVLTAYLNGELRQLLQGLPIYEQ